MAKHANKQHKVSNFKGQKVMTHGGHQGISRSRVFIKQCPIFNSMVATLGFKVVRTIAYLNVIMYM